MNKGVVKKTFTLLAIGYWLLANSPVQAADVVGHFPTLLESNGARAKDTDTVWLGELRDREANRKDQDNDDGVIADLHSCATSRTTFLVHLAKPGKTSGTVYLNLWFDWNKDGQWSGGDTCAKEWALQNFPIDLSRQATDIQPYTVSFPAGRTTDVWYRATISLDEKITSENGGGEFRVGEVEDYGPAPVLGVALTKAGKLQRVPGSQYGATCDPISIFHGDIGQIEVKKVAGSEDIHSIGLPQGFVAKNGVREIKNLGQDPKKPNSFLLSYTPKTDAPRRLVQEWVPVEVNFGGGILKNQPVTKEIQCSIWVWHDSEELIPRPVPKNPVPIGGGGPDLGGFINKLKEKALGVGGSVVGWIKDTGGKIFPPLKKIFTPQLPVRLPVPSAPTRNIFNVPQWVQFVPSETIKSASDVLNKVFKISQIVVDTFETQGELNIRPPGINEGGLITPRTQVFNIILPTPEPLIVRLPVFEGLVAPGSPLNFFLLSERLRNLSESLKNGATPAPAPVVTPANSRCIAKLLEDSNERDRYKYEAQCTGYQNCSLKIRNLTSIGGLVSQKTFDLPMSGPLINTDYIPTGAAIAEVGVNCDGIVYSVNAHSSKAGSGTTFSPAGVGPEIKTGSSLPGGTVNSAYSQTISALGGSLPYTWSVYSGSLPTGLSLGASTGVISGTPSAAATYNFTIIATGGDGRPSRDKAFSIVIAAAANPLSITTTSPIADCHITCQNPNPPAVPNAAATGGTSPYTWALSGLDACATNNSLTITSAGVWGAVVVGNCTGHGTLTVTDSVAATANLSFAIQMLTF